ncbi:MAG: hypothetical protein HN521_05925 [Candidatus Latescibacteria bacterium]|jgi:hypothetical protein|nr:hypothetical protein [Candidatus Latescibacterota bacterium]
MGTWSAVGPDLKTTLDKYENPIKTLADAEVPAFIMRNAYDPAHCQGLIQRFTDMGLMRDSKSPRAADDHRVRIDVGTSLGNRGSDKEGFLGHAETTHFLFDFLFKGFDNPVDLIYDSLAKLCPQNEVKVAYEPDGRQYGPAIFRVHYDGQRYKPHIDHVVLREGRTDYSVYRYKHQFAGVLCLQNADASGPGVQSRLHRYLWQPEVQPHIDADTFDDYAKEKDIGHCQVELEPGDLYFFNTRCIHEVPEVKGDLPRIVLAVFIGYSEDEDEVMVWS